MLKLLFSHEKIDLQVIV